MLSDATRTALCGALLDALFPSGQDAQIEIMSGLLPATMPAGGTVLLRIQDARRCDSVRPEHPHPGRSRRRVRGRRYCRLGALG